MPPVDGCNCGQNLKHGSDTTVPKRLDITRAQVRAIAAAAKETGCTVEVERGGTIYRVVPEGVGTQRRGGPNSTANDEGLDVPEVPDL